MINKRDVRIETWSSGNIDNWSIKLIHLPTHTHTRTIFGPGSQHKAMQTLWAEMEEAVKATIE